MPHLQQLKNEIHRILPEILENCRGEDRMHFCPNCSNSFGREITLADVLRAIETTDHYVQINTLGHFTYKNITGGDWGEWDLKHDSLDSQSPETIDFLWGLLVKE